MVLPNLLADVLGGLQEVVIQSDTLQGALNELIVVEPRLYVHLYTEAGQLRRHIRCFLNDQHMAELDSFDQALADGDVITILQAISGGQPLASLARLLTR